MAKKQSVTPEIKPTWSLINEDKKELVDKLFEIYKQDKEKARVFFFLKGNVFKVLRKVLFESPNGDFRVVIIQKTYGISKNCRMYSRERTLEAISYKKKRFHYYNHEKANSYVRQLNYMTFNNFCVRHNHNWVSKDNANSYETIMNYFIGKFGWIRYVNESMFWGVSFNVIQSKKLFDLKAMLRYQYSCPYPVAKFIHEYTMNTRNPSKYFKVWREMRKQLINIENLKQELFYDPLFQDTCRMAQMVGQKINCSWSQKRLKSEHDKWSKIITQVMLETEPLRELNPSLIFREFAKHSRFELLTTNHALLEEGMRMHHCVGTYSKRVEDGECGIFRAYGCTLELVVSRPIEVESVKGLGIGSKDDLTNIKMESPRLIIRQYQDVGNTRPPQEAWDLVKGYIDCFTPSDLACSPSTIYSNADLPF